MDDITFTRLLFTAIGLCFYVPWVIWRIWRMPSGSLRVERAHDGRTVGDVHRLSPGAAAWLVYCLLPFPITKEHFVVEHLQPFGKPRHVRIRYVVDGRGKVRVSFLGRVLRFSRSIKSGEQIHPSEVNGLRVVYDPNG